MRKRFLYLLGILILISFMENCAGSRTKIADMRDAPGKFNEQKVKVSGKVTQTFAIPFLGQSLVKLDDGSGEIWIKPNGWVPFEGQEITVEGTMKVGLTFANKNFGLIVVETEKKTKR